MRRRAVLIALCGAVSTAGCLNRDEGGENTGTEPADSGDDTAGGPDSGVAPPTRSSTPAGGDRRYVECPREIIPYEQFPAEIQAEIGAALGGRYEADRVYLREAMDVTGSYIAVDDAYYNPAVATDGETEVLTLQRVEPKALPSGRPVTVEHRRDGERVITVEAVAADGTVLVNTTMDLWPGGAVEFGRVARVGTHEFRVSVADSGDTETQVTEPIRVVPSLASVHFAVGPEEVQVREAVADAPRCRFVS